MTLSTLTLHMVTAIPLFNGRIAPRTMPRIVYPDSLEAVVPRTPCRAAMRLGGLASLVFLTGQTRVPRDPAAEAVDSFTQTATNLWIPPDKVEVEQFSKAASILRAPAKVFATF